MAVGLEDAGFQIRDMPAWRFTQRAQFKAFGMDHFVGRMDITEIERERIKKELQGRKTPQLQTEFETMVLAQKPRKGTFVDNWREYRTGLIDSNARLNGRGPKTIMTVEKPQRAKYNGHLVSPQRAKYNGHSTIKPLKLLEYLIRLLSVRGQVVLDPFLGSGTTAIAAARTGRSCIGIEVDKDTISIVENRMKAHHSTK